MTVDWSHFQKDIFAWVERGSGNAVVEAVAGGAKTTTLVEALKLMRGRAWFGAFNKHIAEELQAKAPSHARVSTIHSLGFGTVRRAFGNVQVDKGKMKRIVKEVMGTRRDDHGVRVAAEELADKARLTLTDPSDERALMELVDRYDISTDGEEDWVVSAVKEVIEHDVQETSTVDFTDMLYLPHNYNLSPIKYPWICIDEAQDMNAAQRELVLRAVRPGGRILAVGDEKQAIYRFSGADADSIELLVERTSAKRLPLSVCYRCPSSHLDLARQIVPHIQNRPGAPAGTVRHISHSDLIQDLQGGDLVICRVNKHLPTIALDLIRVGKKAAIRGKGDLARNLGALIRKVSKGSSNIDGFLAGLVKYRDREVSKLVTAEKDARAELLRDKVDTIFALADGVRTVGELEGRLAEVFSDNTDGIVCSSIHRAKGLEADRVAIYKPELTPHPMATGEEEVEQEHNLRYVSLTRAKESLWFVSGKKSREAFKEQSRSENAWDRFFDENDLEGLRAQEERKRVGTSASDPLYF